MISRKSRTENVISNDENETSIDQISEKDVFDDDHIEIIIQRENDTF